MAIRILQGEQLSFKRAHIYILLALSPALFFQNCGQDYNSTSLYGGGGGTILDSEDCISDVVDCGARTEFLLLSVDSPDPLIVTTASYIISGRCNTGNYPEHYIRYEVRDSVGVLVAFGNNPGICMSGRYEFLLNMTGVDMSETHTLLAFVVGVDAESRSFSNNQSGGSDQIDFYRQ